MFNLNKLVRPNILGLKPYSSARDEFGGEAHTWLDANENSLGSPMLQWHNRYPDPHQKLLKEALSGIKGVPADNIFIGNGSDECIDLLYRCFCSPGRDNVIICPPTYGMYEVSAHINDVEVRSCPLTESFQLDLIHLENRIDDRTKLIWLCSPNNPTGNSLDRHDIETVLNNFDGIVVVDEAYVNFARQRSFITELGDYPNLVVMQTFSKAWGLAGLRVGMAFASVEIVQLMDRVKPPYNIGSHTQSLVLEALGQFDQVNEMIREIVSMRDALAEVLQRMPSVDCVFPSDANFLLVRFRGATPFAQELYAFLTSRGIVVRDRSSVPGCEGCLRITVGTEGENTRLVDAIAEFAAAKK